MWTQSQHMSSPCPAHPEALWGIVNRGCSSPNRFFRFWFAISARLHIFATERKQIRKLRSSTLCAGEFPFSFEVSDSGQFVPSLPNLGTPGKVCVLDYKFYLCRKERQRYAYT